MENNKTFCETCREYVEYRVEDEIMCQTLKDKEYVFNGKETYCTKCGSFVWVGKINDYNLKALYDVYRKENDIISLEKIRELPEKYSISKKDLSLLLGWEEETFARYYNGAIPHKHYSDILNKLYDEPEYYLELVKQK